MTVRYGPDCSRDAADLIAVEHSFNKARATEHPHVVSVSECKNVTPIEGCRSVVELPVEWIFRIVVEAARIGQHLDHVYEVVINKSPLRFAA